MPNSSFSLLHLFQSHGGHHGGHNGGHHGGHHGGYNYAHAQNRLIYIFFFTPPDFSYSSYFKGVSLFTMSGEGDKSVDKIVRCINCGV